ncbi:hypothetical protein VNO77_15003 [Canavalia gladiata]|uniref:Uncharacterized protein n=1 Tax=Canavalia gladiata TaxID=3824 RepID=A0AAN9QR71_CANGL
MQTTDTSNVPSDFLATSSTFLGCNPRNPSSVLPFILDGPKENYQSPSKLRKSRPVIPASVAEQSSWDVLEAHSVLTSKILLPMHLVEKIEVSCKPCKRVDVRKVVQTRQETDFVLVSCSRLEVEEEQILKSNKVHIIGSIFQGQRLLNVTPFEIFLNYLAFFPLLSKILRPTDQKTRRKDTSINSSDLETIRSPVKMHCASGYGSELKYFVFIQLKSNEKIVTDISAARDPRHGHSWYKTQQNSEHVQWACCCYRYSPNDSNHNFLYAWHLIVNSQASEQQKFFPEYKNKVCEACPIKN